MMLNIFFLELSAKYKAFEIFESGEFTNMMGKRLVQKNECIDVFGVFLEKTI
jgi:hypothetical protein